MGKDANAGGQELVAPVRVSTDVSAIGELEKYLLDPASAPAVEVAQDPADIQAEIVAQLLSAESDQELERVEAQGWRDLPGVPIEVRGFAWRPSAYTEEGGYPVFLVVRGFRMDTGDPVVLTTGSGNVMAQLANMAKRGTLVGAIRELTIADKQTARGFKPCWLSTPASVKAAQAREAEQAPEPTPAAA